MAESSRRSGQLIQKGERLWLVRLFQGRDTETGKRKYINKTIHGTKKEAQAYLNKALHEKDLGTFIEPSKQTLDSYLDQWEETAAKPRLRERTYNDYKLLLLRYVRPELGKKQLFLITPLEIQTLYSSMQQKGLSARTIRYTHAVLHSAFKQAQRWRIIALNPTEMVELPKNQRREMTALSSSEANKFLKAAEGNDYYALFLLAITTGMRPGEYLGLKWSDINLDAGSISIQRSLVTQEHTTEIFSEPKTARSRRTISISSMVIKVLKEHREKLIQARWKYLSDEKKKQEKKIEAGEITEPEEIRDRWTEFDLVFPDSEGGPMDLANFVKRHFKEVVKRAELTGKKLRLYDLRHSCATILLEAGENPKIVSERLGHASIVLTLDTYSHVLPDMQQKAAEKVESLIFGTPKEKKVAKQKA